MFAKWQAQHTQAGDYTHSQSDNGCDLQGMDRRALMNAQTAGVRRIARVHSPTDRSQVAI